MISAMWKSLSSLPPRSVERAVLVFRPSEQVESFAWLDLIVRMQEIFPNLKTVAVGLEYYAGNAYDESLEAVRRAPGIRQLEENGTVSLCAIPWQYRYHDYAQAMLKYS